MGETWSRVYGNGATMVPSEIRKALGIEVGDILVWRVDSEKGVAIVEVRKDIVSKLEIHGSIRGRWTKKMVRDAIEKVKRRRRR